MVKDRAIVKELKPWLDKIIHIVEVESNGNAAHSQGEDARYLRHAVPTKHLRAPYWQAYDSESRRPWRHPEPMALVIFASLLPC